MAANNIYHILNGDALKDRFPSTLEGELIIMRECLVDGPVASDSLSAFYQIRTEFINEHYTSIALDEYYDQLVSQYDKIMQMSSAATIYLWFEDDLFCQVNMWFVIDLLHSTGRAHSIYLVRPIKGCAYSFADMTDEQLIDAKSKKVKLSDLQKENFSQLWHCYKHEDLASMWSIANDLNMDFPHVLPAVKAHQDRIPQNDNLDRLSQSLLDIVEELGTDDFASIFELFSAREAIYGYGDLQLKRLMKQLSLGTEKG